MIINFSELKNDYDIVIIGAGVTGLALSRFLYTQNKKILIVEAGKFKFDKKTNKDSYATVKNFEIGLFRITLRITQEFECLVVMPMFGAVGVWN